MNNSGDIGLADGLPHNFKNILDREYDFPLGIMASIISACVAPFHKLITVLKNAYSFPKKGPF